VENTRAVRHGCYSGRLLAERAAEIRDALMTLPHAQPLDVLAAEEIGSMIAALEAIDRDLREREPGATKRLLEHKARLSRELRAWLREFGGQPKARSDWARQLAGEGGLAAESAGASPTQTPGARRERLTQARSARGGRVRRRRDAG
jgi:hypothetical protein